MSYYIDSKGQHTQVEDKGNAGGGEMTQVQCPECGAIAEVETKYLGGYGYHQVAYCQANEDHQTPLVWENGAYRLAVYYRRGLEYRIISRRTWELQRAQAECLTDSDYLARMDPDGAEPWQYEPDMPPQDPPGVAEAMEDRQPEPAYITVRINNQVTAEVL